MIAPPPVYVGLSISVNVLSDEPGEPGVLVNPTGLLTEDDPSFSAENV